ncbi:MAG: phosphotransferase [Phycisphaerales bacterium]|nr:phosphotransferase [Hyphomonadaceae bacterium]
MKAIADTSQTERAARAATEVARNHGLRIEEALSLGGYSNTIVQLAPLPLVARVATATGRVRSGTDWLAREIEVAAFLAASNANAVRPTTLMPPGPHMCDGLAMSFWEQLDLIEGQPKPAALGAALHALHDRLERCDVALPSCIGVSETYDLLHREDLTVNLDTDLTGSLRRVATLNVERVSNCSLYPRPLHGDAHYGNYWRTPTGWVWGDFEDVQSGPIEWDLACLAASSVVLGNGVAAKEALAAYGAAYDTELLATLIEARTLQAVAWALVNLPAPMTSTRFQKRVSWLRQRFG